MWELPNDRSDFARMQGAPADHSEKTGRISYLHGSASTPDSVTEKAVLQPGSDSQNGVWRDRQHRHWERSATGMYPLTTAIQHLRRNIMREALEEWESGLSVVGRMVTNLGYADDTTLLAGTK